MKLIVYKGFDNTFLEHIDGTPLVDSDVDNKKNVLKYDKKTRKKLDMALLSLEDNDTAWVTYEEYTLIKNRVDDAIAEDGLKLTIYRNNLYPDYYPIEFDLDETLVREIIETINGDRNSNLSEDCQRFVAIYNALVNADGVLYGSFYNFEYDNDDKSVVSDFYP